MNQSCEEEKDPGHHVGDRGQAQAQQDTKMKTSPSGASSTS